MSYVVTSGRFGYEQNEFIYFASSKISEIKVFLEKHKIPYGQDFTSLYYCKKENITLVWSSTKTGNTAPFRITNESKTNTDFDYILK